MCESGKRYSTTRISFESGDQPCRDRCGPPLVSRFGSPPSAPGETPDLAEPAALVLSYEDAALGGWPESDLAMFRWNENAGDWERVVADHDLDANTISTSIERLGLYTIGTTMPAGFFEWTVTGITRVGSGANLRTEVSVESTPIRLNTGAIVPPGTVVHVQSIDELSLSRFAATPLGVPDPPVLHRRAEQRGDLAALDDQRQEAQMAVDGQEGNGGEDEIELRDGGHLHAVLRVHEVGEAEPHAVGDHLTAEHQGVEGELQDEADGDADGDLLREDDQRDLVRPEWQGRWVRHHAEPKPL